LIPAGTGVARYAKPEIEIDEPEGPGSSISEAV
jgi:hypothetical protein